MACCYKNNGQGAIGGAVRYMRVIARKDHVAAVHAARLGSLQSGRFLVFALMHCLGSIGLFGCVICG